MIQLLIILINRILIKSAYMNYQKIYNDLINRGQNRVLEGYSERHHIVPRCMGGSDEDFNLVRLTPEEHYVAHQLLTKIHPLNVKLIRAVVMMMPNRPNNKMYGWVKRRFSKAQSEALSGSGNSNFGVKRKGVNKNGVCRQVRMEHLQSYLDDGWSRGFVNTTKKEFTRTKRKIDKNTRREQKINELRALLQIYLEHGFVGVQRAGYKYSQQNLVAGFKKLLPEFISQMGKSRIK